jgi:hypothetical protein
VIVKESVLLPIVRIGLIPNKDSRERERKREEERGREM